MKLTPFQISEIATALDDNSYEHHWYWDRQKGEMLFISDMLDDDYTECGFDEDPEENPERFIKIEGIESRLSFRVMEDFTSTLPEGECRRALVRTLNGRKPFANFRNTLYDFPEEQKAWHDYHNAWLPAQAEAFITENNLGEISRSS